MTLSEIADTNLHLAARRAYEIGRLEGALWRGAVAALFALPGFLVCNGTSLAAVCLGGFALVVVAGRVRGGIWEDGARAGAIAGVAPCLLPAALRTLDPNLCAALMTGVPWPCAVGGLVAGAILALRGRPAAGLPFWASALAAASFAAAIGCIPAGAMGFAGLLVGVIAGGAPVLVATRLHRI
jgi:hypothetical protein